MNRPISRRDFLSMAAYGTAFSVLAPVCQAAGKDRPKKEIAGLIAGSDHRKSLGIKEITPARGLE